MEKHQGGGDKGLPPPGFQVWIHTATKFQKESPGRSLFTVPSKDTELIILSLLSLLRLEMEGKFIFEHYVWPGWTASFSRHPGHTRWLLQEVPQHQEPHQGQIPEFLEEEEHVWWTAYTVCVCHV